MVDNSDNIDNALPLRLRILDRITTVLSNISIENGFAHDLKGKVFRGRMAFGDNDPETMVSILESPMAIQQMRNQHDNDLQAGPWEILIKGFVIDDMKNPTDPAYMLMADVKKAMAMEKNRRDKKILGFKNAITTMVIGAGVATPSDETSAKAYFWLTITLDVIENMVNPYQSEPE